MPSLHDHAEAALADLALDDVLVRDATPRDKLADLGPDTGRRGTWLRWMTQRAPCRRRRPMDTSSIARIQSALSKTSAGSSSLVEGLLSITLHAMPRWIAVSLALACGGCAARSAGPPWSPQGETAA